MTNALDIRLENRLPEIHRLATLVEAFGATHDIPARTIFNLNLALDEVLTNIIDYAYPDNATHEILVRLTLAEATLRAEVVDDGPPYDPTRQPDPDTSLAVEDRPIGGLGIYFAKRMMDRLEYYRHEGANHLTMVRLMTQDTVPET